MPLRGGFLFDSEFASNQFCSGCGEFRIGENSSFELSPVELFLQLPGAARCLYFPLHTDRIFGKTLCVRKSVNGWK